MSCFYYCKTGDKKSAFVFAEVNVNVKFGVGREEDVGVGDDDLQKFAALRASQRILASKWQTGMGINEFVHQMYILRETALGKDHLSVWPDLPKFLHFGKFNAIGHIFMA